MYSTKGVMSLISISRPLLLFFRRSSRTAAHPGVRCGLALSLCLVSWIAAMLTLLLWRKVSSSVIYPLIPFAFHNIRRRQLVGNSGCWCRHRSMVQFDIVGTLKQTSEQQCRHRLHRHQKGDLTRKES